MNIGDVITTAGALNSLPQGALLLDRDGDAWGRGLADDEWGCTAVEENWNNDPLTFLPLTVLYLPGRLPRPERVVKAEALREAAAHIKNLYATPLPPAIVHSILHGLAAYAEAREA